MNRLIDQVKQWGHDKGIFKHSTPLKQHVKTQEEVTELLEAMADGNADEIEDAIGDIIVTLILQAEMQGTSIERCLQLAYDVISKRQGQMVNGLFVKE
ncbi:MAG: MazG-like family protein [Thiomicrorhabdus sp.]|jgi:NTP pyrophosphatase (non-canonical NTP hydrolase)|nr:MazG-like family protein [Thiomicrorhabdus sp.]